MLIELKAHLPFCLKHTLIYILYSNRIDSIKSVKQSSHYSLLLLFLLLPLEFSSILRLIGITVHKGCLEGLNKPLFFLDCSCLYMSIDRLLPYHVRNEVITKSQFSLTLTMWIVLQSSFRKWTIYSVDTIDLVFFFFFLSYTTDELFWVDHVQCLGCIIWQETRVRHPNLKGCAAVYQNSTFQPLAADALLFRRINPFYQPQHGILDPFNCHETFIVHVEVWSILASPQAFFLHSSFAHLFLATRLFFSL